MRFFRGAIILCAVLGVTRARAQTVRDVASDGITDAVLQHYLLGSGVTLDSWSRTGNPGQFGVFDDSPPAIMPFSKGLIISTGAVKNLAVINSSDRITTNYSAPGDPDFGAATFDAAYVQMTITPAGNTLFIDYVFGSEEYIEYVNRGYNDRMRLFVDGSNCALVPGTTADVSIDTINTTSHAEYFIDNDTFRTPTLSPSYATEMDGFTTMLRCAAKVTPNLPISVKLGVADDGDASYDSWLLIKYQSFNSDQDDSDGDGTLNASDPGFLDPCIPLTAPLVCGRGDFDNDGVSNAAECPDLHQCPNSDGTGDPDWNDLDSDDDAVQDSMDLSRTDPCLPNPNAVKCNSGDADGDGTDNQHDSAATDPCVPNTAVSVCASGDADGDGLANHDECPNPADCVNSDGRQGPDWNDSDSDDDGVSDGADASRLDPCVPDPNVLRCATGDYDSDGEPNGLELSPADPCSPSVAVPECSAGDADGDGIPNGIECDRPRACPDSDRDLIPDYADTDSDGDGMSDKQECVRRPCEDSDGDGLPDFIESAIDDADHDSLRDQDDGDADGDGISDLVEGARRPWPDADLDGIPDHLDAADHDVTSGDSDADGLLDSDECPGGLYCVDSDLDDIPDYADSDSDDDGVADGEDAKRFDPCLPNPDARVCRSGDSDGDGEINLHDPARLDPCVPSMAVALCLTGDADGDGLDNQTECPDAQDCRDTDADGEPDYLDLDSDADGVDDADDDAAFSDCVPDARFLACPDGDIDTDGIANVEDASPLDPCAPNPDALACAAGDADGDARRNGDDPKPSDPCVPDASVLVCKTGDADGDGTSNARDRDPLDRCVPNAAGCPHSDADGIPDLLDPEPSAHGGACAAAGSDVNAGVWWFFCIGFLALRARSMRPRTDACARGQW